MRSKRPTRISSTLFFFSSRRRHTRLQGDWSSDVCSSDLECRSWVSDAIIEVRVLNMKVEVVLTEADIAQKFVEAVEARDLPEKFFFWFTRSAAEWAALGEHAELYGGLWETWKEIAAGAQE